MGGAGGVGNRMGGTGVGDAKQRVTAGRGAVESRAGRVASGQPSADAPLAKADMVTQAIKGLITKKHQKFQQPKINVN